MKTLVMLIVVVFCGPLKSSFRPFLAHSNDTNATYERIWQFGQGVANDIAWNLQENILAVGGSHGIWLYSPTLEQEQPFANATSVEFLSWSPDGTKLASGFNGIVRIQDRQTGNVFQSLHPGSVWAVHWSPDNDILAISSGFAPDYTVGLWDGASGKEIMSLRGHQNRITELDWHPVRNVLAGASWDNNVYIWDMQSSQPQEVLPVSANPVTAVAWSPDGSKLAATSSVDASFVLWDTANFQPIPITNAPNYVGPLAWDDRSERIAGILDDGSIVVWNPVSSERNQLHSNPSSFTEQLDWHGGYIAALDQSGVVYVWDSDSLDLIAANRNFTSLVSRLAFNPHQNWLTVAYDDSSSVDIVNTENAQIQHTLEAPLKAASSQVAGLAWNGNGTQLAIAYENGNIHIWNSPTLDASELLTVEYPGRLTGLEWHPSQKDVLAVISNQDNNQVLILVDTKDGYILNSIQMDGLRDLWWSPDGKTIAAYIVNNASDQTPAEIRVLDGETFEVTHILAFNDALPPTGQLAWLPDSSALVGTRCSLAVSQCSLWKWDWISTATTDFTVEGDDITLHSALIRFSPDGQYLAISDGSKPRLYIVNSVTGKLLLTIDDFRLNLHELIWADSQTLFASDGVVMRYMLTMD